MASRKIQTFERLETKNKVIVRYNSEYQEYVCKLYVDDMHIVDADYFTDDKQDAFDTAQIMLNNSLKGA